MNFNKFNKVVLPCEALDFKMDIIAINKSTTNLRNKKYSLDMVNVEIMGERWFSYRINGSKINFFIHAANSIHIFDINDKKIVNNYSFILFLGIFFLVETSLNKKKEIILKEKPKETVRKATKGNNNNSGVVYVNNKIYKYEERGKRHNQRHTESWSVRGHWRHYRNGKTIFIEAFNKGKKNSNNKTYIIKEDNNDY